MLEHPNINTMAGVVPLPPQKLNFVGLSHAPEIAKHLASVT